MSEHTLDPLPLFPCQHHVDSALLSWCMRNGPKLRTNLRRSSRRRWLRYAVAVLFVAVLTYWGVLP